MQIKVDAHDECIREQYMNHVFRPPIGCNPVLDGTPSAQNGLETDGANEEYTLMSIDTIINGKVIIALYSLTFNFLAMLVVRFSGRQFQSVGQSSALVQTEIALGWIVMKFLKNITV